MMDVKKDFNLNRGLVLMNNRESIFDDYERTIIDSSDSLEKIALFILPLPVRVCKKEYN